ncbi:hypothetical protein U1Q18_051371, partial [Sarracenia purpurea var. burkii]
MIIIVSCAGGPNRLRRIEIKTSDSFIFPAGFFEVWRSLMSDLFARKWMKWHEKWDQEFPGLKDIYLKSSGNHYITNKSQNICLTRLTCTVKLHESVKNHSQNPDLYYRFRFVIKSKLMVETYCCENIPEYSRIFQNIHEYSDYVYIVISS